jgi:50S ribosomal subunit-associated GTPase HflX
MKDVNCAVMVYDVSNRASLENLKVWNLMFEEHQTPEAIKLCVGNKIDLPERQVSKKEGEGHAALYNSKHLEVSAKQGKRVEDLFNTIIDLISDNLEVRNKLPPIDEEGKREARHPEEHSNKFTLNSKKVENGVATGKKKENCC